MKKGLKISLRILLGLLAFVLVAIIVLPFMFKDQIKAKVLDEANKNLNAKVQIGDFGLSLFRSFPDFSLTLNNMYVAGVNEFEKDTLIKAERIYVSLDLMSVLKGEKYEINTIELDNATLKLLILKNNKANWDIAKPSSDKAKPGEAAAKPSSFKVGLKKFVLNHVNLDYSDATLGFALQMLDMNHTLKGDLTEKITTLKTKTLAAKTTMTYGGISYLNKVQVDLVADIDFDMEKFKFTFRDNELKINDLIFGIDGFFAMPAVGYDMDIKFKAKKSDFKSFLSLVPGVYAKDFANIQTSGNLQFDGFVKGHYSDTQMPAFDFNLKIDKARFKYPSLPKSVENINIDTKISNPDGTPDKTVIDIRKFHFESAGNAMDIRMHVATPISDAAIEGSIKGKIDLGTVKDFYPLEQGDKLSGLLTADLALKGRMSSIDKKEYDKFNANGTLQIQGMNYVSKSMPDGVKISDLILKFSSQFVELQKFAAKIKSSDFNLNGRIDNMLGYYLRNETLKGAFNLTSGLINVNEFMSPAPATPVKKDTVAAKPMSVIEIPGNLDVTMTAKIGKLIYDKMDITNIDGVLKIADKTVDMSGLKMNMLGGSMLMKGKYSTKKVEPDVDFNLDVKDIDIHSAYSSFDMIKTLVPIAEKCVGKVSVMVAFTSSLDRTMKPVYATLNGSGNLKTASVAIKGVNSLDKIAQVTKMDKFKNTQLSNLNISFKFEQGRIRVEPFDFKLDQAAGKLEGYTTFDQKINYIMDMVVPTKSMGSQTTSFANGLIAQANKKTGAKMTMGDKVDLRVLIGGTVTNPDVKADLKGQMNSAVDDLKSKANEELQKKKAELEAKAKAEADQMKKQAEDKAKAEADKVKKEAEDRAKAEADRLKKQADDAKKKAEEDAKKKAKGALNKLIK